MTQQGLTDDPQVLSAAIRGIQHDNDTLKLAMSGLLQQALDADQVNLLDQMLTCLVNQDVAIRLLRHELSDYTRRGNGSGLPAKAPAGTQHDRLVAINLGIAEMEKQLTDLSHAMTRLQQEVWQGNDPAN